MARKKSATARRREGMADNTPTRALVLPLALSPDQHAMYSRLADLYNRVWGRRCPGTTPTTRSTRPPRKKPSITACALDFRNCPRSSYATPCATPRARCARGTRTIRGAGGRSGRPEKDRPSGSTCAPWAFGGNLLTLSSMHGLKRQRFLLPSIPAWFDERYPERRLQAVTLVLDPNDLVTRLTLTFRIPKAEPVEGRVLGVDLGMHALYKDSEGGEYRYPRVQRVRRRYAYDRRTLQEKGTRSAHRRLKAMRHREERFIRDVNHRASKRLANTPNVSVIAFEDLAYIRRQARKGAKTGRRRRNMLNQWPFAQLQEFTAYKAARNGVRTMMVNPAYTSQKCNRCGYVDARNRDHARFDCLRCGHNDSADRRVEHTRQGDTEPWIDPRSGCRQPPMMDGVPATTSPMGESRGSRPRPSRDARRRGS